MNILRDVPTMEHPVGHADARYGGHAEILYEDVRVPAANLLGAEGEGFLIAQHRLVPGRIHHCMRWLGQSRRAFDMLCERALSREAHGSSLAEKQTVQNWIADSAAEMQAARLMTLRAAWVMDTQGASAARSDVALIKFFGAKVMHDVIDRAIQVHGALGYSGDMPLERMYRFARSARIYDGPDEVHRQSVARRILRGYEPHEVPSEHVPTNLAAARERFADAPRDGDLQRLGRSPASRWSSPPRPCWWPSPAGPTSPRAAPPDRFDAPRAMALIRAQVAVGQRPAGSRRLRRLAVRLRAALPHGRFAADRGRAAPAQRGRLAAREPAGDRHRRALRHARFARGLRRRQQRRGRHGDRRRAGAGAAGRAPPGGAPALRFVLFDGEEPAHGLPEDQADFYSTGLRGSRAYARRHAAGTRAMLLLDYVANRGLRLPREGSSDAALWAHVRAAAQRVGAGAVFPDRTDVTILDDHTPFLRAGVPAVDLIDWSYDGHSLADGLDKLSVAAVDAVGETLFELLRTLR